MPQPLHVATRKGLFVFERGAKGYASPSVHFLGDPVSMSFADPRDGSWYAALALGHFGVKLRRSDDHGRTWNDVGVPVYPEQPADLPESEREKPGAWTLHQIWSLEAADPRTPGTLWCGTIPGGLFRSDDRGQSWTLVRSLWDRPERRKWFGGGYDWPGIHSVLVDPRDPKHVTVGVSCGGVWTTRDAGSSWELIGKGMFAAYMPPELRDDLSIQDPHLIVACPSRPDAIWAQHHNGIFKKPAQGKWQEVEAKAPSRFGFACAVDPNDPEVAWFVPAVKDECRVPVGGRLVVTRTRDGGKSFEVLKQGLPKETVWDLVYRHGLDISADGRMLVMGSTTGGLWVSENGGRGWSELSSYLPLIYGVRFFAD